MGATPSSVPMKEWRGMSEAKCKEAWTAAKHTVPGIEWSDCDQSQREAVLARFISAEKYSRASIHESKWRRDWYCGGVTISGCQYFEVGNVGAPCIFSWEYRIDANGEIESAREG